MKKEDWEKAKSRLRAPLGQVDLLCDGYSVTLVNECISMFRNGIAVYVNGEIRGSWFVQDCEERRRFIPQKETSLMSRKQIAAYNKMPKKDRGLLKKFREKTFTAYQTHWTNWQALVKHFEANNADSKAPLGDRLCAIIKKELGMDAFPKDPFAWIGYKDGNKLVEVLKGYVKTAQKSRGDADG